ncbi:MAG: DUF2079 domain-containing protein [Planctomycetota bacterium]|nr:DUF2079 domain-containing protein [Planctomycetota bacterium]
MVPANRPVSRVLLPRRRRTAAAVLAGFGWAWAYGLIATHEHLLEQYYVFCSWDRLWGCIGLPAGQLALTFGLAVVWTLVCLERANQNGRAFPRPLCWLAAAYVIPLLDVLRIAGVPVPLSFLEPLGFIALTGFVAADLAQGSPSLARFAPRVHRFAWLGLVWLLTVAAGVWWYGQGLAAYDSYLLGYHDFGHFAWRVANTWEGRGFLQETPSLPAFWDHFNPGLALLAPLWGLWPDAQLFILLQAICLALPAPLVFGIARVWGARESASAAWSVSYLLVPSVSQLNLNFSYGWHPVSMALPLIFLAVWLLLKRQRTAALVAMLLACSFEETIVVAMACLCFALTLQAWWLRPRQATLLETATEHVSEFVLAQRLPTWGWLTLGAALTAAFLVVFKVAGFAQFQTGRFSNLGNSCAEIALSPWLRPRDFWGQILRVESLYYLLALTLPLGFRSVVRGWPMLLAAALPVGVLLAWQRPAATCIAFQYVTTLIPVLLLAALSGASRGDVVLAQKTDAAQPERRLFVGGIAAIAAGLVASTFFGALPWSSPTLSVLLARTYVAEHGRESTSSLASSKRTETPNPRAVGTEANALLQEIVALVGDRDAAVLASGRIASHLLRVRRLESVEQGYDRWQALAWEAGEGSAAVEVFDWVVLDMQEEFQQSHQKMQFCLDQALRAGYQTWRSGHGIMVLARGRTGAREAPAPPRSGSATSVGG